MATTSFRANYARTGAIMAMMLLMADSTAQVNRNSAEKSCLIRVQINPESRVKAEKGPLSLPLTQGVWRDFPVRFENEAKVTSVPRIHSPNAPAGSGRDRWLDIHLEPVGKPLTGKSVEYRTLRLRSRDSGRREASFAIDVGQGTQDIGFRGEVSILFHCLPAKATGKRAEQ